MEKKIIKIDLKKEKKLSFIIGVELFDLPLTLCDFLNIFFPSYLKLAQHQNFYL